MKSFSYQTLLTSCLTLFLGACSAEFNIGPSDASASVTSHENHDNLRLSGVRKRSIEKA